MRWWLLSLLTCVLALTVAGPAQAAEPAEEAEDAQPAEPEEAPGPFAVTTDLPAQPRFIVVALDDEVGPGMAAFVDRVVEELVAGDVLVLDINTFGGQVPSAVAIRDALLGVPTGVVVVAYVNPRAISAGALISYAAHVIVVGKGATIGAATPVQLGEGGQMQPVEQKIVAYMREEMSATAEARGRRGDVARAMVDPDHVVAGLIEEGKTLALDGQNALAWGVASFQADDLDALIEGLGYDAASYDPSYRSASGAEQVAAWLTSSTVAALLMSLGMLGISIGLYLGGSPIALGFGGVCLGLFFFGHTVVNLAGIEDLALLAVGVVLIGVEVVVPGHIFPGVLGALCVFAALALGLLDLERVDFAVQWEAGYIADALTTVGVALLTTAGLTVAGIRMLPRSRFGRRIVLTAAIDQRADDKAADRLDDLVDQSGTAYTDLRPAGKVSVGGHRHEAIAEVGFIEKGTPIKVIRREGYQLVVASKEQT